MRQARGRLEVAVQDKRIEVSAVGPHNRPQLIIDTNLREEAWVGKRLEHGTVQLSGEVDIARTAVAEAEPQPIVAENLDIRDPHEVHGPILRQRVDRLRRATVLCPAPVRLQLQTMQRRPLAHEFERTTRQLANEHRASLDRDHRMMRGVLSMEMGRFVIVEVHRDHDAVEGADSWHDIIMVSAWDGTFGNRLSTSDRISKNDLAPLENGDRGTMFEHGPRLRLHPRTPCTALWPAYCLMWMASDGPKRGFSVSNASIMRPSDLLAWSGHPCAVEQPAVEA